MFRARHFFDGPVYNVLEAEGKIYAKAGQHLYVREGNDWDRLSEKFDKLFVFYHNGFFGADYIGEDHIVNPSSMKHLIPQVSMANCTAARLDNHLFVAVGGALYEYTINPTFTHYLSDYSVRDVYLRPGLEVASTYGGIFVRDSAGLRLAKGVGYASGEYWSTPAADYLLSDLLFERVSPDSFALKNVKWPDSWGRVRRGALYKDSMVIQLTHSICFFNPGSGLKLIHNGYEYNDLEVINNLLVFSTTTGEVFASNGSETTLLANLKCSVYDVLEGDKFILLATEKGIFTCSKTWHEEPHLLVEMPKAIGVVEDFGKNLWVTTYNGLFIIPKGLNKAIPFVEHVEFNRGALTYYADDVYAGSIQGIYKMNYFTVARNFLPQAIDKLSVQRRQIWQQALLGLVLVVGLGLLLLSFYKKKQLQKIAIVEPPKEQPAVLTLDDIAVDITRENIQTVEALAAFYKTNPVQINRLFKTFETTPGKFLKKVKLEQAYRQLKEGMSMEEVAARSGYTAVFIKSELKKMKLLA